MDSTYREGRVEVDGDRSRGSLGDELAASFAGWVTHRKDEFAERVDEVAEQLSQAARHLARRQPGTAALLRLCGARLGSTAALIAERSPTDHLRRATRIAEAHPTLFVGGLVGGAVAGVLLTRPRRTRRG